MEKQEIIASGLLELFVLGIASPEERLEVESWAKRYPEVAAEIRAIESGMESYAQANAVQPSTSVKEKILSRTGAKKTNISFVDQIPSGAKVYSLSSFWKYAAAASIILLIGSMILNYTFYNKYKSASGDLEATRTELQKQEQLAKAMHEDMGVMADKNAMPVSLKPMPDVADAAARIYWMQNTGDVYIDPSNLPKAPDGMQYQFWAIVDNKPVSGGMITMLKDGKSVRVQKMKSFGKAQAFAVSLEKAGAESPAPTKVYVMGKI